MASHFLEPIIQFLSPEDDDLVIAIGSNEVDMMFQEEVKFLENIRSFEISKKGRLKAADSKAMAIRVGVNPKFVIFVLKAMIMLPMLNFRISRHLPIFSCWRGGRQDE
jgi:hypothetical protein